MTIHENIYMDNNYYKEVKIKIKNKKFIDNEVLKVLIKLDELELITYIYETVWR